MKRDPRIVRLSWNHQHGLALALRARKAAAGGPDVDIDQMWADVCLAFDEELAEHFEQEEQLLLPALEAAGEAELVRQTHEEHRRLRDLLQSPPEDKAIALQQFGELLTAHIRFEERTLFERVQQVLDSATLDRIGRSLEASTTTATPT